MFVNNDEHQQAFKEAKNKAINTIREKRKALSYEDFLRYLFFDLGITEDHKGKQVLQNYNSKDQNTPFIYNITPTNEAEAKIFENIAVEHIITTDGKGLGSNGAFRLGDGNALIIGYNSFETLKYRFNQSLEQPFADKEQVKKRYLERYINPLKDTSTSSLPQSIYKALKSGVIEDHYHSHYYDYYTKKAKVIELIKFEDYLNNLKPQQLENNEFVKDMKNEPHLTEHNIFDKIIKELDLIEHLFYTQTYPYTLEEITWSQNQKGRYCNEIYINTDVNLFEITLYKNHYTNRIENNNSSNLLRSELTTIYNKAIQIYNYFIKELKDHKDKKEFYSGKDLKQQVIENTVLFIIIQFQINIAFFDCDIQEGFFKSVIKSGITKNCKNETLINFCIQLIRFIDLSGIIKPQQNEANKSNEVYKKQNLFKVGLLFAKGEMDKYFTINGKNQRVIKNGLSAPKIASDIKENLGVDINEKYILASINNYTDTENRNKNIFNRYDD